MTQPVLFQEQIGTEEELRSLLGFPSELVRHKVIDHLDENCRDFIALSPYLFISTANSEGECDVSPRGDAPGFTLVLDDKHLVIPERPGNRRLDSMLNIFSNPHVGLIFLIPGLEETLRVNGRACVFQDQSTLCQMEAHGHRPLVGIGVEVEECYVHCAKSLKRSRLWQPDSWPGASSLPNPAEMVAVHVNLPGMTVEKVAESLHESYTRRLY